jgi:hypothetical protein
MKSIFRYILLMLLVFGAAFLWRGERRRSRGLAADEVHLVAAAPAGPHGEYLLPTIRGEGSQDSWTLTGFQNSIEEAFLKNEPCAVLNALQQKSPEAPATIWAAGMQILLEQSREKKPLLQRFFASPDSPLFGGLQPAAPERELRFFTSLLQMNLWHPYGEKSSGLYRSNEAVEILRGLIQEDPDNGIYHFYLAQALRQSGAEKKEMENNFIYAAKAARFDPFYQGLANELQAIGLENSATFAFVHTFLDRMPAPEYAPASRILKSWAKENDTGKWIAGRLARRLSELGAMYKKASPTYSYSHTEYLIGQNLLYTVNGRAESDREGFFERMKEAQAFISEKDREVRSAEIDIYGALMSDESQCQPSHWRALHEASREKLRN